MEKEFLERYFGNNDYIKDYAKKLILIKELNAAKELNKIVNVLGLKKNSPQYEINNVFEKLNKKII